MSALQLHNVAYLCVTFLTFVLHLSAHAACTHFHIHSLYHQLESTFNSVQVIR